MNLANCSICDDLGVLAPNTTHNPSAGAIPCECRMAKRKEWLVRNANIPSRYQDAVLGNYETGWRGCSESQTMAKVFAQKFVDEYLTLSSGQSVLFHGGIGTGKTHLGVGILRGLIEKYGVPCYFFDQTESFEMLKLSYGSDDPRDTKKIIGPSLEAEVLLLDDLGLMKLSDWGMTTVSHILTTRYNRRLTTILTTRVC